MHIVVSDTVVMGDDVHHNCDLVNDVTNDVNNGIKILISTAALLKPSENLPTTDYLY